MHVDEQKRKRVLVYSHSAIIIVHKERENGFFSSSCCSGFYDRVFNGDTLGYNKSGMKTERG